MEKCVEFHKDFHLHLIFFSEKSIRYYRKCLYYISTTLVTYVVSNIVLRSMLARHENIEYLWDAFSIKPNIEIACSSLSLSQKRPMSHYKK